MMASMSDLLEKLNKRMDNLEMKARQQSASMDSDAEDDGKVENKSIDSKTLQKLVDRWLRELDLADLEDSGEEEKGVKACKKGKKSGCVRTLEGPQAERGGV